MPYDKFGRTEEMAERDHDFGKMVIGFIGALLLILITVFATNSCQAKKEQDWLGKVNNVSITVWTDPDTNQEYLITNVGGISPRMDAED